MAHDFVKDMVADDASRVGVPLASTLAGGVLLATSLLAGELFPGTLHAELIAMAAAVLLGAPLVVQAAADLWRGTSQMNELAALAVLAAFVSGAYLTSGAISFFMVLSILIERRSALGAHKSIESLIRLSPTTAQRIRSDGSEEAVSVQDLRVGERVRVRPGGTIPADGEVLEGRSAVQEASITGESIPAEKRPGAEVFAGTMNLTGVLQVVIRKVGDDTTLGQVKRLILEAERTRTPVMRLMDRYAGWYVPLVLMLAGVVLFFTRDMERAVAMLVIACPCAMILSAPTASLAALSAAARLGLLVKNVADLEVARRVSAVVFDKTGTLTTGRLHVARIEPVEGIARDDLLLWAAAVEANSHHPVARAVVEAAERAGLVHADIRVEGFEERAGRGVCAELGGEAFLMGRVAWLQDHEVEVEDVTDPDAGAMSILHLARNGVVVGWIGLEDRIRPGAEASAARLAEDGIGTRVMLTGDRQAVAERVGRAVGCTAVLAEILPDEKMAAVESLKDEGHVVAVIGDGVNDAPALAAGHVSVAMGAAGSDAAIHSASIALMNNELNRIPFLLELSRKTSRVIAHNLLFSAGCVALFLALGAAGYVHPVLAVLLHTGSALVVIVNSARLVRMGENLGDDDMPETETDPEADVRRRVPTLLSTHTRAQAGASSAEPTSPTRESGSCSGTARRAEA